MEEEEELKKNILLFALLVFLLLLAYLLDQRGNEESSLSFELPEKIEKLVIGDAIFEKTQKGMSYRKHYISSEGLLAWKGIFKQIKILGKAEKVSSPKVLRILINQDRFEFYDINPLTGNFIVKRNKDIYIAQSNISFSGFYKDELEKKALSYKSLLINLSDLQKVIFSPFVKNLKIFSRNIEQNSKKIDFINYETTPEPPKSVGIDREYYQSFKAKLEALKPRDVLDLSTEELEELARFKFNQNEYKYYEFGEFSYLKDLKTGAYLEFDPKKVDFLFQSIKNFWSKKLVRLALIQDNMKIKISKKSLERLFSIDKKLNIFSSDIKRDPLLEQGIREILCYLSFCHSKYTFIDVVQESNFDETDYLKLNVLNKEFYFKIHQSLLYVHDIETGLSYKYLWPLMNKKNPFREFYESN